MKPKVLCVTDYYLPGHKAGGPIRTIVNMAAVVADKVNFSIVTRDRDEGDDVPFESGRQNEWQEVGGVPVYYASPETFGAAAVGRNLAGHDLLYLNSFFSYRGSLQPMLRFHKRVKILIAPRGEFSPGALAIKAPKKRLLIGLAKAFNLYRDVTWHASTPDEASDIERVFPGARIEIAPDPVVMGDDVTVLSPAKRAGELSIAFISRISPKKNLDYLLGVLAKVEGRVRLDIYGPIQDNALWERCLTLAGQLQSNVSMEYCGDLSPEEVSPTFARHDLFAFPTHGENFGHVIFEALRAGTPVLLSDQTPWKADQTEALRIVPLSDTAAWRRAVQDAVDRDATGQALVRSAALDYARRYVEESDTDTQNVRMFERVAT